MAVLDMFRLDDKVVIVTGASSGLGVAFARAAAEAGASVVLAARRVDKLADTQAMVESLGATAHQCRHRRRGSHAGGAMVDAAVEVVRPGRRADQQRRHRAPRSPATRETPEQFRTVIDVNLNGSYWTAQAAAKVMQPGSSIVNISSVLGSPPPACRRPRTQPARPGSSASPETSRSSGVAERASASTRSHRASSSPR